MWYVVMITHGQGSIEHNIDNVQLPSQLRT